MQSRTNIEQLQNHTIGATISNGSTTTEQPTENGQHPEPLGGLNAFLFADTKSSPYILLLLKHKNVHMEAS